MSWLSPGEQVLSRIAGEKSYELTNHLGNVLSVVSDKKVYDRDWQADLQSSQDYYAFGMQMPGRSYNSEAYRFGFNGKENDNEVKGTGNQQDYGMRIYDPRLGRFLSIDPLTKNFAMLTPYQFASNSPIWAIDLDGLEAVLYDINFGEKVTTTKIELPKAGPLGNGVAIRINKGSTTTFFYGNEVPSGNGEAFTKAYESKENKVYDDGYGNLTGGYGHKLTPTELKTMKEGDPVSQTQMDSWFSSDYSYFDKMVTNQKPDVSSTQQDALTDFAFNIKNAKVRLGAFSKEKGGDYFLDYMAGGSGLWKRRFGEKLLYEEGKYVKFDRVDFKKDKLVLDGLFKENFDNRLAEEPSQKK